MSRGLALMMSVLIVGPLLLVAVPAALAVDNTPDIAGAWSGSGEAGTTATTTLDGTHGVAEFNYEKNLGVAGGVPLTTWTFQSTAQQDGTVHLGWRLVGHHSYFQVRVGLSTFVNGTPTAGPALVAAGPEDCCTEPSGGFDYDGTTSLTVQNGDTFGLHDHRQQRRPELVSARHPARRDERRHERELRVAARPERRLRHDPHGCPDLDRLDGRAGRNHRPAEQLLLERGRWQPVHRPRRSFCRGRLDSRFPRSSGRSTTSSSGTRPTPRARTRRHIWRSRSMASRWARSSATPVLVSYPLTCSHVPSSGRPAQSRSQQRARPRT